MKVLIIGPSRERSKGGMSTVIQGQLDSDPGVYGFHLEHIVSHVDGGKWEKLYFFLKGFWRFITKKDISLVHIHVASGASFYRKSVFVYGCKLKRIPVIMHIHGHEFDDFFDHSSLPAKYYIRKTFQQCNKVLVLSNYWYEFFCKKIIRKKVEVLRNGVDISYFSSCYAPTDTITKFLFLGRLGQRKGVYDFLEAIRIIVNEKKYTGLTFYLAGDGDLEEVESIILQNKLGKHVIVPGWLDNKQKAAYLKNVYTVVLPSYSEGLPMSLLEAMAAGKVVISTRVGGIPELVAEGENGFLFNPGDVHELVKSVLYVVNHIAEMETISRKNMQKIQHDYDIQKTNRRLYDIYSELLIVSEQQGKKSYE